MMMDSKIGINKIWMKILVLVGIIYMSTINYILFHSFVELITIIIALTMSVMAFNTHEMNHDNHQLIFLGIAYGFVAGFDFLHLLSYKGITFSPEGSINLTIQLFIIARYMESISLLIAYSFLNRKTKFTTLFSIYTVISIAMILVVIYWRVFPDCYLDRYGKTPFIKNSEYIIVMILTAGILMVIKNRNKMNREVFYLMICSFAATIISELFFSFDVNIYGFINMWAHVFKLISFYFIYRAIIEINLKKPYIKLLKSEERYRTLVNLLPSGVCIHDRGKMMFVNPKYCEIMGARDHKELIGKCIFDFVHHDYHDIVRKRIEDMDNGKIVEKIEEKIITMDGKIIDVEVTATPFPYGESNAILVIVRDITEEKRVEALQKRIEIEERLLQEAKEYDRIKTAFLSTVSHELKTPLNIILGVVQLLASSHEEPVDCYYYITFQKYINMMRQNCYRLLKLINNLIDITKFDSGFMEMHLKNYNIVDVIENITLSVAEYTKIKGLNLIFDTDTEEKIMACDADKMERVMLNLLSNALKFTEANGTIEVNLFDRGDVMVISVKDTGIGIPKDMQEEIFERFKQVDSSLRRSKEGSGIGLSLVKSIIQNHGGRISVVSHVGRGSEFIMELPIKMADGASMTDEIAASNETNVERINIEFSDIYPS